MIVIIFTQFLRALAAYMGCAGWKHVATCGTLCHLSAVSYLGIMKCFKQLYRKHLVKKNCVLDGLSQGCGSENPHFSSNTNSQYWLGAKSHS